MTNNMTNTNKLKGKEVKEVFKTSRKYWLIIVVAIALIAGIVGRSEATQLTISNWDFDDVALDDGKAVLGIDGWSGTGTYGTRNPSSTLFDVEPTDNVAWLNSGSISQDISSLNGGLGYLNAGHQYTLSVDVGYQFTPSYTIELLAGGVSFLSTTGSGAAGSWETVTISGLAYSNGGPLEIRLGTDGKRLHFDNVKLTNDTVVNNLHGIPEPATLVLLGSGLLGVALFGKKKFKA